MANFFTKLFSAGASSLVDAVGDAIDKNYTTDEEKRALDNEIAKASMQHELEMTRLGLKKEQIYLQDTDSARVNQSRVQESEYASWLAKNVHSILALGIIGLTFFMYAWLLSFDSKEELGDMKDIIIYILGALTTISTQVTAYFFGSSLGSKDKQKTLAEISTNK